MNEDDAVTLTMPPAFDTDVGSFSGHSERVVALVLLRRRRRDNRRDLQLRQQLPTHQWQTHDDHSGLGDTVALRLFGLCHRFIFSALMEKVYFCRHHCGAVGDPVQNDEGHRQKDRQERHHARRRDKSVPIRLHCGR